MVVECRVQTAHLQLYRGYLGVHECFAAIEHHRRFISPHAPTSPFALHFESHCVALTRFMRLGCTKLVGLIFIKVQLRLARVTFCKHIYKF